MYVSMYPPSTSPTDSATTTTNENNLQHQGATGTTAGRVGPCIVQGLAILFLFFSFLFCPLLAKEKKKKKKKKKQTGLSLPLFDLRFAWQALARRARQPSRRRTGSLACLSCLVFSSSNVAPPDCPCPPPSSRRSVRPQKRLESYV